MTDNELLLAISEIFDKKADSIQRQLHNDISELRTELKGDISELRTELKGDISELRTELKGDISELRTELKGDISELRTELKDDISELRTDMNHEIHLLKLQNENGIIPRLQNIEACYTSTFNRYKNSVETYEVMQQDVKLLKQVVREHGEKLKNIS